jgi:nitrate reductase cytochrome c-type subunit
LLRHEAEESNCLNCHDGSVAKADIATMVERASAHAVGRTTGIHDPAESDGAMREHVECVDCHSPHTARTGSGSSIAPTIKPGMYGARGVTRTGTPVDPARYEYEVCYRCHSTRNFAKPIVSRVEGLDNIANEFSPNNQSYHPVEAMGRNTQVPSLVQKYNAQSIIYCTDCHGSDDASIRGPHGSSNRPLLTDRYETRDGLNESQQNYALCYRCHQRNSILNNESFSGHNKHMVDVKASCATCHDPHGVDRNTHLVNFDSRVVGPSKTNGQGPTFTDLGTRRGSCTLNCHSVDHVDEQY